MNKEFDEWLDKEIAMAKVEIAKAAQHLHDHVADFIRFKNRSIGQVRRYENAKLRGKYRAK